MFYTCVPPKTEKNACHDEATNIGTEARIFHCIIANTITDKKRLELPNYKIIGNWKLFKLDGILILRF